MNKMKLQILLSLFFAGIIYTSCYDDKGNYNYDWVPKVDITLPVDTVTIGRGDTLRLAPEMIAKLFDKTGHIETGEQIVDNYDDFTYTWYVVRSGQVERETKPLSTKYNLDEPIYLPLGTSVYHRIELVAINKTTGIASSAYFHVNIIGTYKNAYLFLTEDEEKNVELEMYVTDSKGDEFLEKDVLKKAEFPYTTEGANCVFYQKHMSLSGIWIATGSGVAWIDPISLSYNPAINNLSTIMAPPVKTFKRIVRGGSNSSAWNASYIVYFTPEGNVHGNFRGVINPHAAIVDKRDVKVLPTCGMDMNTSLLWDVTNGRFIYFPSGGMMGPLAYCVAITGEGAAPANSTCVFLGNSNVTSKKLIGIAKHPNGEYWKYEYSSALSWNTFSGEATFRRKIKMNGTESLANINNLFSNADGEMYCFSGNTLHTYREQVQDPTSSAWKPVEIYDAEGKNKLDITFDPVTLVHLENFVPSGTTDFTKAFYVITHSATKGSTMYAFISDPDGEYTKIRLLKKIEGLGNVKSFHYWGY